MRTNTAIHFFSAVALTLFTAAAQAQPADRTNAAASLPGIDQQTTLPIVFSRTISAKHAKAGDAILARTAAPVRLSNEEMIPAGAPVLGHVVAAAGFFANPEPYAQQKPSTLAIAFDSVAFHGAAVPLHVTMRAMADPVTSRETLAPLANDIDPDGTTTQVGGDQVTPFLAAITDADGKTVGYQRNGHAYAHLIGTGACDASSSEQAVGIFSASACGLYGMPGDTLSLNTDNQTPVIQLTASGHTAQIHADSEALLEQNSGTESASIR